MSEDWNRCACGQLGLGERCPAASDRLLCEDLDEMTLPQLRELLFTADWQLIRMSARAEHGEELDLSGMWAARQEVGRIEAAIEDALWHQGIASVRWIRERERDVRMWGEEGYWHIWMGVLRLRWVLNQRRGPLPGFLPSKEVAVVT
jgi:hypothetical protein